MSGVLLELGAPSVTEYGRALAMFEANRRGWRLNDLRRECGLEPLERGGDRIVPAVEGGMASFTDYLELKVLDHVMGKTSFTMPTTVALGLWTSALTDASTGSTAGEATYTGYARKAIAGTDMRAAGTPTPGQTSNVNAITFAACTAGTSTITFAGTCDALTVGNMLVWFTVTSTVISTTQTPATVAIDGLVVTLD